MAVFTKYSKSRFKLTHLSLISIAIVLCSQSVLGQWPGSYSRKQVRIFEGTVSESLHNIMPYEPFDYTEPNISRAYASSTRFYSKGMGHLYYFTNLFINTILKDQAYPEGFLQVVDGNTIQLADVRTEWTVYWRHYGPTLAVLLAFTLLGLLMPVFGLLFCCCRCTGRCSARTQPFDKRYDFCKRHAYGMLLCALTVLISFGVVCSFVTNENLEEGAHNLAKELRTSLKDVDLYVNNTKVEVNHLLINNFNEFDRSITKILKASGEIVKNRLGTMSNAAVLTNLTNIVHGLAAIRNDLKEIDSLTRSLQDTAEQLEIALTEFRQTLLQKLNQCKNDVACRNLMRKYNIKDLSLEANFTKQFKYARFFCEDPMKNNSSVPH